MKQADPIERDLVMQIGFVGLGSMGLPMACNLFNAGFEVSGYDLNKDARDKFAAIGGKSSSNVKEAVADADCLILMVVNAEQAGTVLFDEAALDAIKPGACVVLMSTCSPGDVVELGRKVTERGKFFFDAPVSGGAVGAKAASLSIMVSGPKAPYGGVRAILEVLGQKIYYLGEVVGHASMAKAINQLLCGVHLAAAAEAMSLAEKAGMDAAAALEIVSGSAASSWMLCDRGARMLQDEPDVTSAVDIFVKDLGIVLDAGASAKAALPLAATAHQLFLAVTGQGGGGSDDSQVIRAYRGLAGRLR
jgi:3-hydroxyisobutyrate dehydrogenase